MFLFGMSSLIAVGGIITIFAGGVGLPLLAGLGMVAAGAQSLGCSTSQKSVKEGANFKKWLGKVGIGFAVGTLLPGISIAKFIDVAASFGEEAINGAINGAINSVISDLQNEKNVLKILGNVFRNAAIGAIAGVTGGAVSGASSEMTSMLEGDTAQQVSNATSKATKSVAAAWNIIYIKCNLQCN